jgi:predicted DNA-binding protein
MPRLRVSEERKAKPFSISLLKHHLDMLGELEKKTGRVKSQLIQEYIEDAYNRIIKMKV